MSATAAHKLRQQARATGEARIGRCVIAEMVRPWMPETELPPVNLVRVSEIETLIRARHGNYIPDPAGTDDEELCIAYVRAFALSGAGASVRGWSRRWAPWFCDEELFTALEAAAQKLASGPRGKFRMLKADAIAQLLSVSLDERTRLGLKTIGACDKSTEEREIIAKARKREADRIRIAARRRIKNPLKRSRSEVSEVSITQARPWDMEGVSRATWYRRQVGETGVSRVYNKSTTRDAVVSTVCGTVSVISKGNVAIPHISAQKIPSATREGKEGFGDQSPAEVQEAGPHGADYGESLYG